MRTAYGANFFEVSPLGEEESSTLSHTHFQLSSRLGKDSFSLPRRLPDSDSGNDTENMWKLGDNLDSEQERKRRKQMEEREERERSKLDNEDSKGFSLFRCERRCLLPTTPPLLHTAYYSGRHYWEIRHPLSPSLPLEASLGAFAASGSKKGGERKGVAASRVRL